MSQREIKDKQTVTPEGKLIARLIEGVAVRPATTIPDERGTICEIYSEAWDMSTGPLVYVYQVTVRPYKVKGWVVHHAQDDRIFVSQGTLKWVLFDNRDTSPSYRQLNEIFLSEQNRALLLIPRGVFHAVQNVGNTDALFINLPTRPYNHADPDKYRLPPNNDVIPYRFEDKSGW
jgi:dTDP-4-dehydrorhamnose 3,5-epimerase